MYESRIVAWIAGRYSPTEERDRAHRIALADARFARERRPAQRAAEPIGAHRFAPMTNRGGGADLACCAA